MNQKIKKCWSHRAWKRTPSNDMEEVDKNANRSRGVPTECSFVHDYILLNLIVCYVFIGLFYKLSVLGLVNLL